MKTIFTNALKAITLLLFFLHGIHLQSQTINCVTPNGAGARNGTNWMNALSLRDMMDVLRQAQPGTDFWLAEGLYRPNYRGGFYGGVNNGELDTVLQVNNGVKIYGGFKTDSSSTPIFNNRSPNIHLSIFDGFYGTKYVVWNSFNYGLKKIIEVNSGDSTIVIDGIQFITSGESAIVVNDTSAGITSNVVITNCRFNLNQRRAITVLLANKSRLNLVVDKCDFSNNSKKGNTDIILHKASDGSELNALYSNCLFFNNLSLHYSVITNHSLGVVGNSLVSTKYNHCTFAYNRNLQSEDVLLYNVGDVSNSSYADFVNCILWDDVPVIITDTTGASTTMQYCNVKGGFPGIGNIDKDPMFILPGSNFKINTCSPCINAGYQNIQGVTQDLDGKPRPLKGGYDMGCYESFDTGITNLRPLVNIKWYDTDTFCVDNYGLKIVGNVTNDSSIFLYSLYHNGVLKLVNNNPNITYKTSFVDYDKVWVVASNVCNDPVVSTSDTLIPAHIYDVRPRYSADKNFTVYPDYNKVTLTNTTIEYDTCFWVIWESYYDGSMNNYDTSYLQTIVLSKSIQDAYLERYEVSQTCKGKCGTVVTGYHDKQWFEFREFYNPSSTEELSIDAEKQFVVMYPNPAIEVINIRLLNFTHLPGSIQILNTSGQVVMQQSVVSDEMQLDVAALPQGLYMVQVMENNQVMQYKRFVKE